MSVSTRALGDAEVDDDPSRRFRRTLQLYGLHTTVSNYQFCPIASHMHAATGVSISSILATLIIGKVRLCRSNFPLRIQMICLLSCLQSSPAQNRQTTHACRLVHREAVGEVAHLDTTAWLAERYGEKDTNTPRCGCCCCSFQRGIHRLKQVSTVGVSHGGCCAALTAWAVVRVILSRR